MAKSHRDTSYWHSSGTHQDKADKLQKLIPMSGSVSDPKKNPKLERFRKAVNVYYDIFNNGGINKSRYVKPYFGVVLSDFGGTYNVDYERIAPHLDKAMDKIVLEAYDEQFN